MMETISIHAPRGGSDQRGVVISRYINDFNPRSPRGERLVEYARTSYESDFNPHSPWGERHVEAPEVLALDKISIHAPRGGGATHKNIRQLRKCIISIHAPRMGGDSTRNGTR